jgi:peptide/nickel transport system substrate-binding protein
MKKIIFAFLLVSGSWMFCGFNPDSKSNAQKPDPKIAKGGTMRIISGQSPQVIGYPPERSGPVDVTSSFPGIETLMTYSAERALVPFLCKKVDVDPAHLSITFHLNKGIQFHDGTELTAEVARWIFQLLIENKRLQYADHIKSVEQLDGYTFRLNLEKYNSLLIYSYGLVPMFSKDAIQKNGKEWARTHCVGTGPFKLVEFKRDEHLYWTRFDNYWRKDAGLPYLDGLEVRFIPDPVAASSIMETGQADAWLGPGAQYQKRMVDRASALARISPVLLGKNSPLQQIGIWKHHRQFGVRQIGSRRS